MRPRPPLALGVVVAALGVALTTLVVYPLAHEAPVLSLGVVYMLIVLVVASLWGLWLGAATALASALAFNFFHIPPTGEFTIARGENWVGLVVFLIAALIASSVSEVARARAEEADRRRREADLAAEMARVLLRGERLQESLPAVAERIAATLDVPSAAIELDPAPDPATIPLREHGRQIARLRLPAGTPEAVRVAAALEPLLAVALERDRLQSEVVETAALRRSDVLKTALLRTVSHDLRSPLTAILTAAEALGSAGISADERRQLAADVGVEATRLSRLIDDLLDLSRLEADAAAPRLASTAVDEVLHAAIDDLRLPDGTFQLAIGGELPPVRADAAQLERAFANLLENASRHSGGHPVSVRARDVGGRILVRVVDRGPGIPEAQRERVFEPFYRSGTEATGHRGSGLGLAIVRGFVEANGGRVWVESLPGQPTSFVVELPLERAPAPVAR